MYKYAVETINRCKLFVLTTHVAPDGDGLGSEVALQLFLESLGKEAHIVNPGTLPARYRFIDPQSKLVRYAADVHDPLIARADVILVLDISSWDRLGEMRDAVISSHAFKICIDHHPYGDRVADIALVDETASSTAEITYGLIRATGVSELTPRVAEALFVGILTDTGSFRFPNTTPQTLRVAADLMEAGADPSRVANHLYEQHTLDRMKLLGHELLTCHAVEDTRIAWMEITREEQQQFGVIDNEVEGFLDVLRTVKQVEIAALFLENADGEIKVSLRSKGSKNVNTIAIKFGGGGHPKAAGCVIRGTMKEVVALVIKELRHLVT